MIVDHYQLMRGRGRLWLEEDSMGLHRVNVLLVQRMYYKDSFYSEHSIHVHISSYTPAFAVFDRDVVI